MKIARRTSRAEVPSMAMGDIAFNLLIFFVILARATDDSHLEWKPASTKNVQQTSASKISVLIDVDNKVYLNGQPIGIAQLAARVEESLGNAAAGNRTVLLKAHREVPALNFQPVIEAISEAGGDLIHILDEQKD